MEYILSRPSQASQQLWWPSYVIFREAEKVDRLLDVVIGKQCVGADRGHGEWITIVTEIVSNPFPLGTGFQLVLQVQLGWLYPEHHGKE